MSQLSCFLRWPGWWPSQNVSLLTVTLANLSISKLCLALETQMEGGIEMLCPKASKHLEVYHLPLSLEYRLTNAPVNRIFWLMKVMHLCIGKYHISPYI